MSTTSRQGPGETLGWSDGNRRGIVESEECVWPGGEVLGKRLLVGITYLNCKGELVRQEEFHGPIVELGRCAIIVERADTGMRVSLPPGWEPGVRGRYRLRSTGEVVVNPDFVAEWTFVEEGDQR